MLLRFLTFVSILCASSAIPIHGSSKAPLNTMTCRELQTFNNAVSSLLSISPPRGTPDGLSSAIKTYITNFQTLVNVVNTNNCALNIIEDETLQTRQINWPSLPDLPDLPQMPHFVEFEAMRQRVCRMDRGFEFEIGRMQEGAARNGLMTMIEAVMGMEGCGGGNGDDGNGDGGDGGDGDGGDGGNGDGGDGN